MKGWLILFILAACSAGDDTTNGTRARCAEGGALNACPDSEQTAEAACWKLVDCGAIPTASDDPGVFTWGHCVDALDGRQADSEQLAIACISASSCDALKTQGSPRRPDPNQMPCFLLGGQ